MAGRKPDKTPKTKFSMEVTKSFLLARNLSAMDLVRLCNISIPIAYRVMHGTALTDLNTIYKIYTGLKRAEHPITWKDLTGIE